MTTSRFPVWSSVTLGVYAWPLYYSNASSSIQSMNDRSILGEWSGIAECETSAGGWRAPVWTWWMNEWMRDSNHWTAGGNKTRHESVCLSVCLTLSSSHGHESPREPSFVLGVQTIEAIISVWSLDIPHPIKFPRFRQYNAQLSYGCNFLQVIKIGLK